MTLVMQTEAIVSFLGNKIKFYSTVHIFGSRSMVALVIAQDLLFQCVWPMSSLLGPSVEWPVLKICDSFLPTSHTQVEAPQYPRCASVERHGDSAECFYSWRLGGYA